MKKFSKTLSLFLTLAMLLSAFSSVALAGGLVSDDVSEDILGVDHGVYQDNLTWTVEGDTLYIGGEGSMKTYDLFGAPWMNQHRYDIKHAIISEGVTSISSYAFYNMSALETISIAESVTSIGACAFYNCSSLKSIKLPSAVTKIEFETFFYCLSLENVEMSESVTFIGEKAFYFCEKLKSIIIPSSVTNIADDAFEDCAVFSNIIGDAGSFAEEYALNKGFTFIIRTPESEVMAKSPVDLGAFFYAIIYVPALDKAFTNTESENVVADTMNGSAAQVWQFRKSGKENIYTIQNMKDEQYLTVIDRNDDLSNVIVSYDAQQYNIYAVGDKYVIAPYEIKDQVVDVNGVDSNVQYWTFSLSNPYQQYEFIEVENIYNLNNRTAVDLGDDFYANINVPALDKTFTNNGANNVVASAANGSDAQLWHFVKCDDTNSYKIESKLDGQYITIKNFASDLSNVSVSTNAQEYHIYEIDDKYVIAPGVLKSHSIDVNGVDFNVQYRKYYGENACQKFDIVKIGGDDTSSDETSEEVSDVISEEVSEEISEEVSEEISEEVSEEISEEVSEEISEEVSDIISEEVSEEISDETSEEISDVISEEVSDETSEEISDETSEETSENPTTPEDDFYMNDEASTMPNMIEKTDVSQIISALGQYNITATVTDQNGNLLEEGAIVGTGCIVKTSQGKEYTVVIKGDIDGTGIITATDYLNIKKAFEGDLVLSGAFYSAADTDGNNLLTTTDYVQVKSYFLGNINLYA